MKRVLMYVVRMIQTFYFIVHFWLVGSFLYLLIETLQYITARVLNFRYSRFVRSFRLMYFEYRY